LPMPQLRGFALPALDVACVCAQVHAGLEETVIEVEVEMMGLDVVQMNTVGTVRGTAGAPLTSVLPVVVGSVFFAQVLCSCAGSHACTR